MAGAAGDGDDPLSLFAEEMQSEEPEIRIAAMKKLRNVALAIGKHVEDDDEVLLVMAEQLGDCVDVLGSPDAVDLVEVLGLLATTEETVVREAAVTSINKVVAVLPADTVASKVVGVVERLTKGDWFTARVSACGLFAGAYERLGAGSAQERTHLRKLFAALCNDDTPMVRRAASKSIGALVRATEASVAEAELIPLFNTLAGDDQDSVRLLAIGNCAAFAEVLSESKNKELILPLAVACAEDKSWRVRNNVAKDFHKLARAIGRETTLAKLVAGFVRLLQDPEAEVRASAAKNAHEFCEVIGPDAFVQSIVPCLSDLSADVAQSVRVCLAGSLVGAIEKLSEADATKHLLPLVLHFFRPDEAAQVRVKVLASLDVVARAVGKETLKAKVLEHLITLKQDSQWRVRSTVIDQTPLIAKLLGADVFSKHLLEVVTDGFSDHVHSVRFAASRCLKPLAEGLGAEWAGSVMVPKLQELYRSGESFMQRITVVHGAVFLAHGCKGSAAAEACADLVVRATSDAVPNVRFVGARAAESVAAAVPKATLDGKLVPALSGMAEDRDSDVRHYSKRALENVGSGLAGSFSPSSLYAGKNYKDGSELGGAGLLAGVRGAPGADEDEEDVGGGASAAGGAGK